MTEITPALLAEFAHRVPDGIVVPRGTPVLRISKTTGSIILDLHGWRFDRETREGDPFTFWTREPICQPLPTGLGAVLKDVTTTSGVHWDYAVRLDTGESPWGLFDRADAEGGTWRGNIELATWTVVSEGVEL